MTGVQTCALPISKAWKHNKSSHELVSAICRQFRKPESETEGRMRPKQRSPAQSPGICPYAADSLRCGPALERRLRNEYIQRGAGFPLS